MERKAQKLPQDWEIVLILPCYLDGHGDCTKLCLSDGREKYFNVRISTFLRWLAGKNRQTIPLLRKWGAARTALQKSVPLAMNPEMVLMPVKLRKPRVSGDAALGCVNVTAFDDLPIRREDGALWLCLPDGQRIRMEWAEETIRRHWAAAHVLSIELDKLASESMLRKLRKTWCDAPNHLPGT